MLVLVLGLESGLGLVLGFSVVRVRVASVRVRVEGMCLRVSVRRCVFFLVVPLSCCRCAFVAVSCSLCPMSLCLVFVFVVVVPWSLCLVLCAPCRCVSCLESLSLFCSSVSVFFFFFPSVYVFVFSSVLPINPGLQRVWFRRDPGQP